MSIALVMHSRSRGRVRYMTKKRAYTSQLGNQMTTAVQVGKRRNLEFNGQPTGEDYFSTHPPGKRRPVKHVMKGKWFFAYIEGGDRISDVHGGESLHHILFKEALRSLEHVTLSLHKPTTGKPQKWHEAQIRITHAETEKAIPRPDGTPYYADVYLEFDAKGPLSLKWEGKLYLEIRHKHAVEAGKQIELRELDVPVIEVEIPEIFSLKFDEEDTNDEQEEAYRRFVKRTLESEKGFLMGTVLSDPSSKAFLEHLVGQQKQKIQELVLAKENLAEKLRSTELRQEDTATSLTSEIRKIQSTNIKIGEVTSRLVEAEDNVTKCLGANEALRGRISSLKKSIWYLMVALAAFVGISIFLGVG